MFVFYPGLYLQKIPFSLFCNSDGNAVNTFRARIKGTNITNRISRPEVALLCFSFFSLHSSAIAHKVRISHQCSVKIYIKKIYMHIHNLSVSLLYY